MRNRIIPAFAAVFLLASACAHAGVLVLRSANGVQFVDAFSLQVGTHEKVLNIGGQPKLGAPLNKLPNFKLSGTILKDGDANALAVYGDGAPQYFISDGLPKGTPSDLTAIWRASRIVYKKAANDKTPTDVPLAEFAAYLPGGVEELAHLCADTRELEFISGKGKAFATQIAFSAAAAKAYGADPAMVTLQRSVEQAMRVRLEQFDSGAAGVEALDQGLEFAKLSLAAYPNLSEQKQLRDTLEQKRKWIDQKKAILRTLATGGEWDAFLLGDGDFERYRAAFRNMASMHTDALKRSLQSHQQAGEERNKEREYGAAWREYRLASMRKPSDTVLRQSVRTAWGDYSNQVAKNHQGSGKALTPGERSAIAASLQRAGLDLNVKKPERALTEVQDAERIDPSNLDMLLRKAEVLGALHQFHDALAALDQYDLRAVDEERKKAGELRATLEFQRDNTLDDMRSQVRKAYAAFNFHLANDLVKQGLEANATDTEMLLWAGRLGLILRDAKSSRVALQVYLDVTTNLDANEDERTAVRQLLSGVRETKTADGGAPNWLSARKLPAGILYDPASGAFQAKIDRIQASNKLSLAFDWDGDRLRSIVPSFEKDQHITGEQRVSFGYDSPTSGVTWAGGGSDPRGAAPADPDELFRRSLVRLSSNPYADPVAIQKLTNQNLAIGIAGNRFFDPFVWDKVHFFQLTYDDQGRVRQAREVADPKSAPTDQWTDFEWDGQKLLAIRAYQGADAAHRTKVYERTMQYQDNRLVSEEIQSQGKSSKVRYNYTGGRLAAAVADRDPSLDDRSRQVTFR